MAYASVQEVQDRITYDLTPEQETAAAALLDDAALIIDTYNANATPEAKSLVSIRMVTRAIGTDGLGVPIGASQGSQSALGYSQSWTIGGSTGGAVGELYLSKLEKKLLGTGNNIGSYSPTEELVRGPEL